VALFWRSFRMARLITERSVQRADHLLKGRKEIEQLQARRTQLIG
jgi:hypothetical protein